MKCCSKETFVLKLGPKLKLTTKYIRIDCFQNTQASPKTFDKCLCTMCIRSSPMWHPTIIFIDFVRPCLLTMSKRRKSYVRTKDAQKGNIGQIASDAIFRRNSLQTSDTSHTRLVRKVMTNHEHNLFATKINIEKNSCAMCVLPIPDVRKTEFENMLQ